MFGPIFCPGLELAAELADRRLGAGDGIARPGQRRRGPRLGAWVLHQGGMDGERIARRSVAFFLIKSAVNFVAVAVLGMVMALGLVGPELSLWLTVVPGGYGDAGPGLGGGDPAARSRPGASRVRQASRLRRAVNAARRAVIDGTGEALRILRSGNRRVLAGSIGYWAFDNAVLWATFHAFGPSPPLTVILMGYLIGQLGWLLPIPGGIGGID